MPILVNKLIYSIVPSKLPFFIRPIGSGIFKMLTEMLCDKPLKTHAKLVRRFQALAVV